ncbi:MAG: hypothetical protein KJZ96_16610 [Rhodocyclaceae bacterium]|nr:hypothetical protein [Rhodocyclaceae bacterium]
MLHATVKGKSALHERYLGRRDEGERRVHEEDEITSAIFGPLDFMAPGEVARFWHSVLRVSGKGSFFPDGAPEITEVQLWSRRPARSARFVEPDAVVRLRWPGGEQRVLLVELKWRAPLSGEDQLHHQWNEYLTAEERECALHLFIAPETSAAPAPASEGADVWLVNDEVRLLPVTWLRIRGALAEYCRENSALGRWASAVDGFLDKLKMRRFSGFIGFEVAASIPLELPDRVFWRGAIHED